MKASMTIYTWYFVSFFVAPCLGGIVETVAELPGQEFDFLVIGGEGPSSSLGYPPSIKHLLFLTGGTAGNVIANRLTENPKHSVLVLEAGGSYVPHQLQPNVNDNNLIKT